jgi:hypothetical protein
MAFVAASALWIAGCGQSPSSGLTDGHSPPAAGSGCDPNFVPFGGGSGTAIDPYRVCSLSQWSAMAADAAPGRHFVLAGDLDFRHRGAPLVDEFQSVLDGGGRTIRRLGGRGLFDKLSGTVRNLRLVDINVVAGINVGAVAGQATSRGVVEDVFLSGTIEGTFNVGGAVGVNDGVLRRVDADVAVRGNTRVGGIAGIHNGRMETCFARGTVSGEQFVGGLVGSLAFSGGVRRALAGPTVVVASTVGAGGIAGDAGPSTTAEDVVVIANVEGRTQVGGAVGLLRGTLRRVMVAGTVTAAAGGNDALCGDGEGGATQSYFDVTRSGRGRSRCGEGKTTAELHQPATYVGWDVETVWLVNGVAYPSLR